MAHYLLGIDLGSSSVKASLIDADTGKSAGFAFSPQQEMLISSPRHGWAEQDPNAWWENAVIAVRAICKRVDAKPDSILAIGISYQMHGLVAVDKNGDVLRPAIIWCDSRAVKIGEEAFSKLGELYCMERLLNSPGNFTISKLKWVKDNEPSIYNSIHKVMLPGDYLAFKLTGRMATTVSGLSEGIMWDYQKKTTPERLFNYLDINPELTAEALPTFSDQGSLSAAAANALGLKEGVPVSYRAGDQPNNAFSLQTLHPGEIAATAGTSGVIYGIVNTPVADKLSRVNTFVHVNHTETTPRYGVLMCVNGTGIMNSWLRKNLFADQQVSYKDMNALANQAPIGSDKLKVLPFGNGAERIFRNKDVGASFNGLDLNRHGHAHLCRAAQEGIVFALGYGFEILNQIGVESSVIRAGHANMFLSDIFCETFANVTGARLELYNTDGSQGAARGAGMGIGHYKNTNEAFNSLSCIKSFEPNAASQPAYQEAYGAWKTILTKQLENQ